jgi:nucleotide-binding universal stress UspA family protein
MMNVKKILIATDGSERAETAADYGLAMASISSA